MIGSSDFNTDIEVINQMLVTEIIQCKFLCCDFVHRRAGIGDCTDLISVKLFPPVKRSSDVEIHSDHPHELTMIRTSVAKSRHEFEVVRANMAAITIDELCARTRAKTSVIRISNKLTVALFPRVFRIPHATDGRVPTKDLGVFNLQHLFLLSLVLHYALQVHREQRSPHRKT